MQALFGHHDLRKELLVVIKSIIVVSVVSSNNECKQLRVRH